MLVLGEISTSTYVDFQAIVRDTVRDIGYTRADYGFDYLTCGTLVSAAETKTWDRDALPPPLAARSIPWMLAPGRKEVELPLELVEAPFDQLPVAQVVLHARRLGLACRSRDE